ncbi:MAG TPA: hypothetical protein VFP50_14420, partial [Anaeromyxobacteraceae bacterium]|nr:hypothetical protein [Anaeromyxobacteraceae bacterium]
MTAPTVAAAPPKLALAPGGIPPQDSDGQGHLTLDSGTTASRTWFDPELGAPMESIVEQTMRLKG